MSHTSPRRGRRALALVASLSLAAAGVSSAATAAAAAAPDALQLGAGRYVVLLADTPAAAYEGGVRGLARTRPAEGRSYGRGAAEARYERFLADEQDRVLERVGARATQRYTVALNGFAATLTAKQATELASTRGVLAVTPDEERSLDTTSSPEFLGLTGSAGTWAEAGGVADAGRGVVVGIVDSGIWPESASFAGKPFSSAGPKDPQVVSSSAAGEVVRFAKKDGSTFTGLCQAGERWSADDCNTKLVSARWFGAGFLANVPAAKRAATEQVSARDGDGHGTHTASTAAGNDGVAVAIDGTSYGTASGVAPAAKVAAYKVCWEDTDPATGGCYTSDSVAAIDQAVKDGVDVLNYSISGATTTVVDAVELAFFNAAAAGVFVAASAGNSGPGASTVAHNSPWLTTVAASTHSRTEGTVVTGAGQRSKGASISRAPLPSAPLARSTALGAAGAAADDVRLCVPGSLDPAKATGTIVVCDRGAVDRVAKSAEVARAGGIGVVLTNVAASSLDSDVHTIPTVHVDEVAGAAVKAYVDGTAAPTASFEVGDTTGGAPTPVPQIAGFSSRGPALAAGSDLLKPDITAPGVSVIAAVAPPAHGGRDFDVLSGTSMSSPHIAGLAALLLDVHPTWTPQTVKSAMMTTASDLRSATGATATDPFAQGAGHVDPARFADPGLVVTSTVAQWAGFYAGQGLQLGTQDEPFAPLAASDLNVPSIAVSRLAGTKTVSRTFTALRAGRYTVSATVPGFAVTASRPAVTFSRAGQSERIDLTFSRTAAPLGAWAKGSVTLTSGSNSVRLPVALRPVALAAPAEVAGTGTSGSTPLALTAGFTGSLPVTASGLAAGRRTEGTLAGTASTDTTVVVPTGTAIARFDVDAANDQGDFDLHVYRVSATGARTLVGWSATGAADERVTLRSPAAASYLVHVENYAAAPGETTSAYALTSFVLDPSAAAGGVTVTPNPVPVTQGAAARARATWSGLTAGTRYLGLLSYGGDAAGTSTLVSITG